jgi:hypothetical protein
MWFFNSKKYINPFLVCLGVHSLTHCSLFIVHTVHYVLSPFILSPTLHSSFILILAWERKKLWRGAMVLLEVMIVGVFQP